MKKVLAAAWEACYYCTLFALWPLNAVASWLTAGRFRRSAVLHISYPVHVAWETVELLRGAGVKADYLALGRNELWDRADYRVQYSALPFIRAVQEAVVVWAIAARYEILHCHFMLPLTYSGWEMPLLKRGGRKLVAHLRGCEARDRKANMEAHPRMNICQECDYFITFYGCYTCQTQSALRRKRLAAACADKIFVTTPDMLEFFPQAEVLPFFTPLSADGAAAAAPARDGRPFKIVHATNHPGIEGTRHVVSAVERLRAKGHNVVFVYLHGRPHGEVLAALACADLSIGKLKMGYYANTQIESMALGVPAVTYVREEFMTEELRSSGFIFAELDKLESILEYYIGHPGELAAKRAAARESVLRLHDNKAITAKLKSCYGRLSGEKRP